MTSVNTLYRICSKVNRYFGEIDKSNHWMVVPSNESKENNLKIWKTLA